MVYITREIEKKVFDWLNEREIIAIRGPRQSGKTTLLKRIEEYLKKSGTNENNISYITFEDDLMRIEFEKNPKNFIKTFLTSSSSKHFFLLDEIQYISNPGKKLKLIFDTFDNVKLIITGSSSFELLNLGSFLVGRVIFFDLYPFSFLEFLRSKGKRYEKIYYETRINWNKKYQKIKKPVFLEELNMLLREYLTFGSFPRIVTEEEKGKKIELLRNLFTTFIEKDIVTKYGFKYRDKVVSLLKVLASMVSGIVKYEELSSHSGLKYHEIKEILPLLEDSFVISVIRPYFKNLRSELRKNPKIYFVDYGILNLLDGNIENPMFSKLYENFICNEIKRCCELKYWRTTTKTEVDFVIDKNPPIPIEVKTTPKITRSLKSFMLHYNTKVGFVANLNEVYEKRLDNLEIKVVPFVCF